MRYDTTRLCLLSFIIVGCTLSAKVNSKYSTLAALKLPLDKYHNHTVMTAYLKEFAKTYPQWTKLYSIGKSVGNRELWVLQVSAANATDVTIPNVKLIANIHGNEAVGKEVLLQLAQYLISSYINGSEYVTWLMNNTKIHLLPSMNPDGFENAMERYRLSEPQSCPSVVGRYNKKQVDLNRNFVDYFRSNTHPEQSETRAVKKWLNDIPFVLSASLHGGSLVASYPFDNTKEDTMDEHPPSITPDDDVFVHLATVYAETHPTMHKGLPCPGQKMSFKNGITNGAAWYTLTGGMQDYNYAHKGCMEITLEISCCKLPDPSELPKLWDENRQALLNYIGEVQRGLKGIIRGKHRKAVSNAKFVVAGRDIPFFSSKDGAFWRILVPGNYLLYVQATGYSNKSIPFTIREEDFEAHKPYFLEITMDPIDTSKVVSSTTTSATTNESLSSTPAVHKVVAKDTSTDSVPFNQEVRVGASKSSAQGKRTFCLGTLMLWCISALTMISHAGRWH